MNKYILITKNKTTIQNFPNLDILPDSIQIKEKNSIVYLGGISKERGIETTIHALGKLKQEGYKFHFKCIGPISTHYQRTLEQLCNENNITDNVSFLGRLPAEDAYAIVKKSKIGLAILHPIENYLESYPTKVFEYMALRTPYITSDFELYSELTADTKAGVTINPFDSEDLKEKLIFLLNNEPVLKKHG
ncbi:glycosyltransferase [Bacillus cereus]